MRKSWYHLVSGVALLTMTSIMVGGSADAGDSRSASRMAAASRSVVEDLASSGNVVVLGATGSQAYAVSDEADALARMSASQLAGQRVIYSYSGLTPPASLLDLISHGQAAGVMFFGQNYRSRTQFSRAVQKLVAANASPSNPANAFPLLLMTDQEGGIVRRLPGAPVSSEKAIGKIRPLSAAVTAARRAGTGAARNLRSFGLNVNLAPVLDVYRKAGDFDDRYGRSYSMRPVVVSALGKGFIAAQQRGHVAATAKHFPGLGAATATQNTDKRPVTIRLSRGTLQARDEYPYQAAIAVGVKLVMVSWAKYPAFDAKYPAGFSKAIVQGQLRTRLGFGGITITDAIGAHALSSFGSIQNRAKLAAAAGMDLILAAGETPAEGVSCTQGMATVYRRSSASAKAAFQATVMQILELRKSLPA